VAPPDRELLLQAQGIQTHRHASRQNRPKLRRNQAAAQFGVGISTTINWVRRFRETGSVKPDKIGGYRPKKIAGPHRDWLVQGKHPP
jgi:transposase